MLRHPYGLFLSENCSKLLTTLEEHHTYYPLRQDLTTDEGLTLLFADLEEGVADVQTYHARLVEWMLQLLKCVGISTQETNDHLMKEAIYRMYTLFNRLHELIISGDLSVDLITLLRLITQLVQATSIPFHGEPAVGLQVMGVLETATWISTTSYCCRATKATCPKALTIPLYSLFDTQGARAYNRRPQGGYLFLLLPPTVATCEERHHII